MKRIVLSAIVLATLSVVGCKCKNEKEKESQNVEQQVAVVTTAKYKVVPAETTVEWVGSKPAGKHTGTLGVSEGEISVENGKIVGGTFTLDMNSITVTDLQGDEKGYLEGHLKGTAKEEDADHFFNVKKYPTGTFVLKSFDGTNVVGDLTIKEKTKEVSFPATISVTENEVTLTSNSFTINRVDFGVNYASKSIFDNLKDKFVNDEVELKVTAKAKK